MNTQRRTGTLALALALSLASAAPLSAQLGMGISLSGGLNLTPFYADPGLDKLVEIYNLNHPALSDPMENIRGGLGGTFNGGFLFSPFSERLMFHVDMGWSGFTGNTSASDGTNWRHLQISLNTFQSTFSALIGLVPNFVYVGPSIGMQVGDVSGKTRINMEPWVDLSSGPLMGWDIGAKGWFRLPSFPLLIVAVRPWFRMMDGITGYSYISEGLNGYYPPNLFESDLKSFGIQIEAMLSFYLAT